MTSTPRAPGRRPTLPGADELFRTTGDPTRSGSSAAADEAVVAHSNMEPSGLRSVRGGRDTNTLGRRSAAIAGPDAARTARTQSTGAAEERGSSGRERHEEKITVYVSVDELVDLERARLVLRADHGLGVDRGRIVREALSYVLADLEVHGDASILVQRLAAG